MLGRTCTSSALPLSPSHHSTSSSTPVAVSLKPYRVVTEISYMYVSPLLTLIKERKGNEREYAKTHKGKSTGKLFFFLAVMPAPSFPERQHPLNGWCR